MHRRTRTYLLTGVVAIGLLAVSAAAQAPPAQAPPQDRPQIRTAKQMPFPAKPDWAKLEVETLPVQGQVHMIAGAGGNIAVQIGDQGVLLVDTGYEQMSAKVLAAIRTLSNKTLRTVIHYRIVRLVLLVNGNRQVRYLRAKKCLAI